MNRADVYALINAERSRQTVLWDRDHAWGYGDCSSTTLPEPVKVAVLCEEVGEVSRAVLDGKRKQLCDELVQVAAVAVAWLESL